MKKYLQFTLLTLLFATGLFAQSQSSNTVNFQGVTPPPPPTIGTLTPGSGYVGAAVVIAFSGTNFTINSTATFNGAAVPFTFISATSGSISVPAGKVVVGNNPIIVTNPPPPALTMNSPVQLPNARAGQPFSANLKTFTSAICATSCNFQSVSVPTWLTISADGTVTGTPPGAGSASFSFSVTDTTVLAAISRVHFIFV